VRPGEVAAVAESLLPSVRAGFAEAELVAGWLLGLRYLPDARSRDVWQSPLATLSRGGGDCEDLAILALSVLAALGCGGVLVVGLMFTRTGPIGHAWLEGRDSAGWFHMEATKSVVSRFGRPFAYIAYAVYEGSVGAAGRAPDV
jgi:transglutaminase-like putative cysteine protease